MELAQDCISDRIKNTIMKRIHEKFYLPGDKLVEMRLAREFNTDQAPVREALCQLERMRLIENEPFKGARVRGITEQDLKECLQVRGGLENLAAELVEDRLVEHIDELIAIAKEAVVAANDIDANKYAFANLQFHRMIVEASNNQMLINMWYMLAPEVRMLTAIELRLGLIRQAALEHLEIVEAFAEGSNRQAGRLLKMHAEGILMHGFPGLDFTAASSSKAC